MSRTYRRRTGARSVADEIAFHLEPWNLSGWVWDDDTPVWQGLCSKLRLGPDADEAAVVRAVRGRFHRDRKASEYNPPAWFRRMLNAENRAREKDALRRAVADGADDVLPVAPRRAWREWF